MGVLYDNLIFVHVPKTGGNSIESILRQHGGKLLMHNEMNRHAYPEDTEMLMEEGSIRFAFVRNPWDQFVSLWSFFQQTNGELGDLPFDQFVEKWIKRGNLQYRYFHPAFCNWYTFVGRFEQLQDDWKRFLRLYNLSRRLPKDLPVTNTSIHKDYTIYYDDRLRDMVAKAEAGVINQFGYKFGSEHVDHHQE